MGIEISRETELRLTHEARRLGVSVGALLDRFLKERTAATTQPILHNPQLPVWHLGAAGALHRRDVYDDAR